MKVLILIALLFTVVAASTAPLHNVDIGIHNEFLVIFNQNVTEFTVAQHISSFKSIDGNSIAFVFKNTPGYAATLTPDTLARVRQDANVAFVEANQIVYGDVLVGENGKLKTEDPRKAVPCPNTQSNVPSWGLERLSVESANQMNKEYHYYENAGEGVNTYILDTGVEITHPDFAGRAFWGFNSGSGPNTDRNGHGTHVAGTVAGTKYGIAKKATIYAVKVLGSKEEGAVPEATIFNVVAGIDWVTSHKKQQGKPAVANMSLRTAFGTSPSTDRAMKDGYDAGVVYTSSSGNFNRDSCTQSPSNVPWGISVGATDVKDVRSSFSNAGTCTHVFGPGTAITSAWLNNGENTISGTSMSSPHAAGVAALILGNNPSATPDEVKKIMQDESVKGAINLNCNANEVPSECIKSLNYLTHVPCS